MSNGFTLKFLAVLASALTIVGCTTISLTPPRGGSSAAWSAIVATNAPIRVAVYEDRGAGDESIFKLNRLAILSNDIDFLPVDADAICDGALDRADLFVLSAQDEKRLAQTLGPRGCDNIRSFVRNGGSFLGISAGATYALADAPLALAAYTNQPCVHCRAATTIEVHYNTNAFQTAGFKPGTLSTRFDFGPCMLPAPALKDAAAQTVATFRGNVHLVDANAQAPSMRGCASAVAGTYGQGRIWLLADHPEVAPATIFALRRALTYLAHGRCPQLVHPQRTKGQLSVGFLSLSAPGRPGADFMTALTTSGQFDVVPLGRAGLLAGDMTHVDAVVLPPTLTKEDEANPFFAADLPAFIQHGGTVVDLRTTPTSDALKALRDLHRAPAPKPRQPLRPAPNKRARNPVRTVFYGAAGASGNGILRVARMFAASTNYVVRFVDGKDIREGALKDADLYIAPGGGSGTQAKSLGPQGCTNLVNWIRQGGLYHGTCAGAYLASRNRPNSKNRLRLDLMPAYAQECPYRGGNALVKLRYTPAGEKALGRKGIDEMFYHGGPVLLPAPAVPDSDFETLATFESQNVYVFNGNTTPEMGGHAAIVAGRLGKGKVLCMSPHPEADDGTESLVRDEIEFLTGRKLDGGRNWRTRGNLSVAFFCNRYYNDGGELALDLLDLPGFDVSAQGTRGVNSGSLEHQDIVVVSHPRESTLALFNEFRARGGQVYVWYTNEKEKSYIPADQTGNLHVFPSALACQKALKALSDQNLHECEANR